MGEQDGTAWLSASEQTAWRHYLRATRALEVALDRQLVARGMTLAEYEILSMLSEAPGRCLRMSALADLVVQSRSRVTHTATRLERRGWVERRACQGDARGVELVLTDDGFEELLAVVPMHVQSVRTHLVEVMTPEQFEGLGEAMRLVHENLDAQGR